MRLITRLSPKTDIDWKDQSQYKTRGLIWDYIEGTQYEQLHSNSETPTFCFSNIFPDGGYNNTDEYISEGKESIFIFSSPHRELVNIVQSGLDSDDIINIGDNQFDVLSTNPLNVDVESTGTTGTIKVHTGLYLRLPSEERRKYDIDTKYSENAVLSWVPEFGLESFQGRLIDSASWKIQTLNPTLNRYPTEFTDLFESLQIHSVVNKSVNVKDDITHQFVVPTCELDYSITEDIHQNWLNTLLDTGLGWRNALGFGFANIVDKNETENPYYR